MSSGPHRPSCLHGALGCSALPPGANCSPGCSALLPGVLCSPWALSAPPGVQCRSWCSVLPPWRSVPPQAFCALPGHLVLPPGAPPGAQCSPWCSVLSLGVQCFSWCSALPLGAQCSPLGAQRSPQMLSALPWYSALPSGCSVLLQAWWGPALLLGLHVLPAPISIQCH